MAIDRQQFAVVRGVAAGAAVVLVVTAYCFVQQPFAAPKDRFGLWMKWNIPKAGKVGSSPSAADACRQGLSAVASSLLVNIKLQSATAALILQLRLRI
jgi:hypothetical protein